MIKLRSYLKKAGKEESGFTLIELMVVVVILGILGSVVLPRIMGDVTGDAEAARDTANHKMIQTAVDRYMIDTGSAASTIDWTTEQTRTHLTTGSSEPTGWNGPYLDEVPDSYSVTDGIVSP